MNAPDERVPVTLLTGFLGAGKTTLLNHLVRSAGADRIAVIVNEFGDVGVDHDLIEASTEETILMPSGCLCCSIRGDLLRTLGRLVARRNTGALSFDRVVIETTGIADPGPILHSLVVDDLVGPYFRMDGVVALADAATGPATLQEHFEAVHQIAMADLIVLSKTDLVTPDALAAFEDVLDGINASAQRLRADHGRLSPEVLFGLSGMRDTATPQDVAAWVGQGAHHTHASQHEVPHAHHHHHHHRINSASIEVTVPISARVFDFWLDTLIGHKGPDILRVKGIVHLEGIEMPFVFHGVQHIFDAPVPLDTWDGEDTTSRVVVIARDMSKDDLSASLQMLLMQPDEGEAKPAGMMVHAAEIPL